MICIVILGCKQLKKILILAETLDLRLACCPANSLEEDSSTYAAIVLRLVRRKPCWHNALEEDGNTLVAILT